MGAIFADATATIASGAALSGAFSSGDKLICAVQMPAAWTAADLTYQISDDGGTTWFELLDDTGTAVTLVSPAAGKRYNLPASDYESGRLFKVRSGTSSVPVNQAAARTLTFITRQFLPGR